MVNNSTINGTTSSGSFIISIPDDETSPSSSKRVRFADGSSSPDVLYLRTDGVYSGKHRTKLILSIEKIQIGIAWGFRRIIRVLRSINIHLVRSDAKRKVFNPQSLFLHWWNKKFLISCMIAVSIDALFFYIPVVDGKKKCLDFDKKLEIITCALRSLNDLFYILHIIFQFRTGFLGPSSRVYGKNAFIQDRGAITKRYLSTYFLIDILAVLPLPQVVYLVIVPNSSGLVDMKIKYLSRYVIILQFFPRFLRVYPIYKAVRGTFTITESVWVGVGFNLSLYMLASHIFGAIWYLNSIERQDMCWRDACRKAAGCQVSSLYCGDNNRKNYGFLRVSCPIIEPNKTVFDFGVYLDSLQSGIVESRSFSDKFLYCFWWGLQNLGSLGQNLKTSTYGWEVVFVVSLSIFGLFLFTLLIGNVQMYLQSNTIKLEKAMRAKMQDTERWMTHILLPDNLKDRIRLCVKYEWQKTRGFDDEKLLHNLPKDLRRDIKLHQRLALLHRVQIFQEMDKRLLEEMCDRLKPVVYPERSLVIREGDPVEEMIFIMMGTLLTSNNDECMPDPDYLENGDFCGEELLTWALNPYSSKLPVSTRIVQTLTDVEAFTLVADDLKFVVSQCHNFQGDQLKHIFRFYSQQWRTWAACFIQAAWRRYHKKKLEESLYEMEEDKLQDTLARCGGSSLSLGTTVYASRFAANLLRTNRRNGRRNALLLERLSPTFLQKPDDPDFSSG